MATRKKRGNVEVGEMNMTPMIDIVFQMIIFFVCTVELEKQSLNKNIELAISPHGPAVEKKVPGTVTVDVDGKGRISIARAPLDLATFRSVMRKTVSMYGQRVPVVIRGDAETRHEDVRRVMDECKRVGLWKVKFAATKESVTKK